MKPDKSVILFDMDGVLFDSEPQHFRAWKATLEREGVELTWEVYKPCIGTTLPYLCEEISRVYGYDKKSPEELLALYKEVLQEMVDREGPWPIEGLIEVLSAAKKKGYRMAVASSSPLAHIRANVKTAGAEEYFELLFSGENVKNSKPAPDTFLEAAEAIKAEPAECIVVEDSKNGTIAAKAAGMYCIGIANPSSGDQDLSRADLILGAFKDLLEIL